LYGTSLMSFCTTSSSKRRPIRRFTANSVLNVFQKGYLLNGRLLRPAMVVVSKAPSAAQPSLNEQA